MNFYLLSVVLIGLFSSAISCLMCFIIEKIEYIDSDSKRLSAFAILLTLAIIFVSWLLIFTSYWSWVKELNVNDFVFLSVFFVIFFLCGIFWRVLLPTFLSIYIFYVVIVLCALTIFCRTSTGDQILEINSNEALYNKEKLKIELDFSEISLLQENQDLFLVVNCYKLPHRMLLPFSSEWYKPVALSDKRFTENGIQNDLFNENDATSFLEKYLFKFSSFVYDFFVTDKNCTNFNSEYFVNIPVSAFYPHIFDVKLQNKNGYFAYEVERIQ